MSVYTSSETIEADMLCAECGDWTPTIEILVCGSVAEFTCPLCETVQTGDYIDWGDQDM